MESVPRRATDVLESELDDELVLWHRGGLHRLDAVGAAVWRALDGHATVRSVAAELATAFRAPADDVSRDVFALCQQLGGQGLLAEPFGTLDEEERPPAGDGPAVGPGPRPGLDGLRDGAPWAHRARRFQALGFDFSVRSNNPDIVDYLDCALGALVAEGGPTDAAHVYSVLERHAGCFELYLDDLDLVVVERPDRAVRRLLWHVNSEVIRGAGNHLLIHAAGAVLGGTAVVLPGPMNAGKTTLVAGLVRDGFQYLTDELVALNLRSGLVDPYPRPLNLEEGAWDLLPELRPPGWSPGHPLAPRQWHVDLSRLRAGVLAGPTLARTVIAPRFEAGAETRLEALSRGSALELLHDQAMNAGTHGRAGFVALSQLVRQSNCVRLVAGNLRPAVALVRAAVDGHSP